MSGRDSARRKPLTMRKKKPGLSKRLVRQINSGTMGRFCHASQYRGAKMDAGRNDPCPCGRVKEDGTPVKFKRCCGR